MNIYRRVFVQAHLLRVDFLHPRIFQAVTWLMHCSAEKKEFLHSRLLQNLKGKMLQFPDFYLQGLNISRMLNIMENLR